jgi:hypothetical protein
MTEVKVAEKNNLFCPEDRLDGVYSICISNSETGITSEEAIRIRVMSHHGQIAEDCIENLYPTMVRYYPDGSLRIDYKGKLYLVKGVPASCSYLNIQFAAIYLL